MLNREKTFRRQIQHISARIERLEGTSRQYSHIRLITVLLGIPLIWAGYHFFGDWAGRALLAVATAGFIIELYCHGRLKDSIDRHRTLLDLRSIQIARMQLDWGRIPCASPLPAPVEHPFGIDLDILGERSLHHLLDTTVSVAGSRKLADWLMDPAPEPNGIHRRQKLVKELAPLTLFRAKLFVNARKLQDVSGARLDAGRILQWLQKRGSASAGAALLPLILFAGCNVFVLGLGLLTAGEIPWYFYILFSCYLIALLFLQSKVAKAFREAVDLESTLDRLLAVFRHLEKFGYRHTPNLAELCAPFPDPKNRPSALLRRISRIVSGISIRSNPVVWLLINGVFPSDVYFVRHLEECRKELSGLLPKWLDIFAEIEALSALANFAFLNPDYSYPEVDTKTDCTPATQDPGVTGGGAVLPIHFDTEQLGHPLISSDKRVCNSFSLDEHRRIALITGSNMAGKSSFLRTIGVNLRLAYAGAPVCAVRLQTGLFRVFACMRVNDSLTDGFSFFYAEVKRLKMLLTIVEHHIDLPVFFLLDEIFRGTNNQERFIGSRAFIRALADHPAIGAIATHDLELVKLADENGGIANYHFREDVEEGRMVFDYKLRQGPCPTTNALKIMALAGLPV